MNPKFGFKQLVLCLAIILAGYVAYLYFQPVPVVNPVKAITSVPQTQAPVLPWPAGGQAAIGAAGYGLLSTHNDNSPVPVASIAKIITALAILQKKPLVTGDSGPVITFSDSDVALYNDYLSKGGSVAAVSAGEQLSELQALQAMLVPSANNMADSLAIWAFGSVQNYIVYANSMVKSLGLRSTTVGGASGFDDKTTSTAADLVYLGIQALNQPAIAATVSKTSAQLPVAGNVSNTNWLLGQDGVVGVKTGNTDKAGGCYLFASKQNISGRQITLIGAILNQPVLSDAISAAPALIDASAGNFEPETLIHKGQQYAVYKTPWGASSNAVAEKDVSLLAWKGRIVNVINRAQPLTAPVKQNGKVGDVAAAYGHEGGTSELVLSNPLPGPSWHWRLFRH